VYFNRGITLFELGHFEESLSSYAKAIALKPDFAEARFGLCMAELPMLYVDQPDIIARRTAYERRLMALCNAEETGTNQTDLAKGVGSSQPFFLAYQGYNDRDLQRLYGSFVCRIMAERYPPSVPAPSPAASEPVRVGIFSKGGSSNWIADSFGFSAITPGFRRTPRLQQRLPCAIDSSKARCRPSAGARRFWQMPRMF